MKHAITPKPFFTLLLALLLAMPGLAQGFGGGNNVTADLIADVDAVAPGQTFTLGLTLEMEPGWHVYWINPEGPGFPVSVGDWDAPEGFEISDIKWPAPHRFEFDGLVQYGYADVVTLLFEVKAPANIKPGESVTLSTDASWLACEDQCIPGDAALTITLPTQAQAGASANARTFDDARSAMPVSINGWDVSASPIKDGYLLELTAPSALPADFSKGVYFYSEVQYDVDPSVEQKATIEGNTLILRLKTRMLDGFGAEIERDGPITQLTGVLTREGGFGESGVYGLMVDVPIEGKAPPPAPVENSTLFVALGAAFIGGLILNLMPCVFPVLSIKILGFVQQAGENPRIVRRHGYMFGAGVLISFWVLAGVLLALRGAAAAAGGAETFSWGFQMQNPTFVLGMILLVFLIGLNLAGVFEIGVGLTSVAGKATAGSEGYTKSFLSGVLATLIATPCTAPFMAGALGAALAMPTFQAMLVFTALGIGMATPYVVLSCIPALLRYLPRPGAWMESFKQAMSFPMFATAGWLAWVYVGLTSDGMVARLLIGLTIVATGAWVYGRWSTPMRSIKVRWVGRVTALLFAAGGVYLVASWTPTTPWDDYSPSRIEELRAEGRPVLIDFTARWCVTCQANKKSSLRGISKTEDLYKELDVALVEADYTTRDATIGKMLTEYGREGVPLYLVFPADGGEPEILPNILTPDIVADALRRAAGEGEQRAAN